MILKKIFLAVFGLAFLAIMAVLFSPFLITDLTSKEKRNRIFADEEQAKFYE